MPTATARHGKLLAGLLNLPGAPARRIESTKRAAVNLVWNVVDGRPAAGAPDGRRAAGAPDALARLRARAADGRALPPVELLLVQRAFNAADRWSGDVALPGGRVDGGETARAAAVREALEEVGIDLADRAEYVALGRLDDRRAGARLVVR